MKRTGFIAIVGRPNVGKSTLLNAILGEKVAIVSNKPQTTRNRIIGIHTIGEDQFVFLDTPGIHLPKDSLGDYMVSTANTTMHDADAVVLVVDAGKPATSVEENVIRYLKESGVFGSSPSCAADIIAPRKDCGVHLARSGVVESAESTMRVNRSGVMTDGSAFLISPSIALMYCCMDFFSVCCACTAT